MEASIGVNLRVTAHSNQGGRKYMEDMFCVAYQPTADDRDLLYAYFGIFDGHGGREAALYAKHHLMDQIVQQKNFWSDDDELVLKAIHDGFINTHHAMWKELEKWPRTPSGLPSTSGTTASVAFVRRGKLYIGHVGDSGIVMGYEDPETGFWRAKPLTKDHKPESPAENSRITKAGGKVIVKSGVPRVVWNRPRIGHKGPVRRSTHIDEIPFLAVARSLGDLWSYNSKQNQFVVSPQPDCSVMEIDVHSHRCLILGTDGLSNMLSPQDAVNSVYFAEKNNERQPQPIQGSTDLSKSWINPSKRLVDRALDRWHQHGLRADNTSVVTVVVDPPGPPKRNVIRHSFASKQDPTASPVGISRYVPQKNSNTAAAAAAVVAPLSPQQRRKEVANNHPISSTPLVAAVPPSARLPSISHPRVITKTASSVDTTHHHHPVRRVAPTRVKCTRSSDRNKRTSPSLRTTEVVAGNREPDTALQSTSHHHHHHAVSASSSHSTPAAAAASRSSWRDGHHRGSSPPVSTINTSDSSSSRQVASTSSSSSHDDVQIHEISSSSESTKSDYHYGSRARGCRGGGKRKATGKPPSTASSPKKKARNEESIDRRPRITRNSISQSPLTPIIPSITRKSSGVTQPPTTNNKKTALKTKCKIPVSTTPVSTTLQRIQSKARKGDNLKNQQQQQQQQLVARIFTGRIRKRNARPLPATFHQLPVVDNCEKRSLRSASRSMVRCLRKK